jgi:DNA replication protein DnaD
MRNIVNLYGKRELWEEAKKIGVRKFEIKKGMMSKIVNEALEKWIEENKDLLESRNY